MRTTTRNLETNANIAILHVGQLERWRSNLRRKLLVLVVCVFVDLDEWALFHSPLGVRRTVKSTITAVVAGSPHAISANCIPEFTNLRPTSTSEYTSFRIHSNNSRPSRGPTYHARREQQSPSPLHRKTKLDKRWARSQGRTERHCTRCSVLLEHLVSQSDQRGHASRERSV